MGDLRAIGRRDRQHGQERPGARVRREPVATENMMRSTPNDMSAAMNGTMLKNLLVVIHIWSRIVCRTERRSSVFALTALVSSIRSSMNGSASPMWPMTSLSAG